MALSQNHKLVVFVSLTLSLLAFGCRDEGQAEMARLPDVVAQCSAGVDLLESWMQNTEVAIAATVERVEPVISPMTTDRLGVQEEVEGCENGSAVPALDVHLADIEVLAGGSPQVARLRIGARQMDSWSSQPYLIDGQQRWKPDAGRRVGAGQRLLVRAVYDANLDRMVLIADLNQFLDGAVVPTRAECAPDWLAGATEESLEQRLADIEVDAQAVRNRYAAATSSFDAGAICYPPTERAERPPVGGCIADRECAAPKTCQDGACVLAPDDRTASGRVTPNAGAGPRE